MKIIDHTNKSHNNEPISFPALQCWNPLEKLITISAQVRGKRILCSISTNDLKKKYHVFVNTPLKTLVEHRSDIECAARKLIKNGSYEQDGTITIRYKDL
jgi:hypothetical protein